jgi:hypothetical protein
VQLKIQKEDYCGEMTRKALLKQSREREMD